MKFINFPWKQSFYIVFSSFDIINTEIFKSFYIQGSPKNSVFFRFLKTNLGLLLLSLFKQKIDVPNNYSEYVGIVKQKKLLLVEIEHGQPVLVWRRNKDFLWEQESFLGYQIISEYSTKEFHNKYSIIEKALKTHWDSIKIDLSKVHGDLTHFNILYHKDEIFFIDKKSNQHSKLFDFFYFYSYLRQCISRCTTVSSSEESIINKNISSIIKNVCQYNSRTELMNDFKYLNIPEVCGLRRNDKYTSDFLDIFNHLE